MCVCSIAEAVLRLLKWPVIANVLGVSQSPHLQSPGNLRRVGLDGIALFVKLAFLKNELGTLK